MDVWPRLHDRPYDSATGANDRLRNMLHALGPARRLSFMVSVRRCCVATPLIEVISAIGGAICLMKKDYGCKVADA